MKIAQLLSPVHSLGPGERVCLWVQGCSKRCAHCISPEFQTFIGQDINESDLAKIIIQISRNTGCNGLTISGGEPFEQSKSLYKLLNAVKSSFCDILVYTGYTLDEIYNGIAGEDGIHCLKQIDVLIDGRYADSLNFDDCVLRGSTNQIIHYINEDIHGLYEDYIKSGRILETFSHKNSTIITGIISKGKSHE
jgi:anaerobic ribonucleoside-triphosphate reductase activating protein